MVNQKGIQREFWDQGKGGRRSPGHPVVAATFDPLADVVAAQVPVPSESSVLDVGCGNGFLSVALERRFGQVAGLDFSQTMLDVNPCENRFHGSSTDLPFEDSSFDVVVASHLLHHLVPDDRTRSLQEMKRVARYAVVSFEPNRNNPLVFLFSLSRREERMALSFSPSYMRRLFSGLELDNEKTHVRGWTVPNKAPIWWIPMGRLLDRSPLAGFGFDICCTGSLKK